MEEEWSVRRLNVHWEIASAIERCWYSERSLLFSLWQSRTIDFKWRCARNGRYKRVCIDLCYWRFSASINWLLSASLRLPIVRVLVELRSALVTISVTAGCWMADLSRHFLMFLICCHYMYFSSSFVDLFVNVIRSVIVVFRPFHWQCITGEKNRDKIWEGVIRFCALTNSFSLFGFQITVQSFIRIEWELRP